MSVVGAAASGRVGASAVPSEGGGGGGEPSEEYGNQQFVNSPLAGDDTSSAYGWTVRADGDSTVVFSASALEGHRKVTCTCAAPGSVAAIEQSYSGTIGDVLTVSFKVVGAPTKTTPAGVVQNHIGFYDASLEGGTTRPTLEVADDGEILWYVFRFLITGSIKVRLGLDQPGVITFEQPMLDTDNELNLYSASEYEEPDPPAVSSEVGVGVAYHTYGMMPRVLKYNNYTVALCRRAPKTGTVVALGFECASNNPDDINPDGTPISRTKSMGTGNYTLSLELTRGMDPVSGDSISGRFLPLSGGVTLADAMFRPNFSQSLRTGSVTHDRGNNLGSGDRRRWHTWTLPTSLAVTEGDPLCLVGYSKSSGASTDYISFTNSPTMGPSSSSRLAAPWDLSPARTVSPREGLESYGMILAETGTYTATKANKRYQRNPEIGQLTFYYDDGTADGMPLRENNGLTTQFRIGGSYRLRERFRHLGETFTCRYLWVPCYWDDDGSIPGANLTVQLIDETDATTWSASAAPDPEPGGDIVTQVRPFNGVLHTETSFPDFTRFDLGADRTITSGHDFKIELSASSGTYWGYGGRHCLTAYDTTDSPPPPISGLPALTGQSNPNVLSYGEKSTNGGSSWSKFSLYGSDRTDVSLSYWLQPVVLAATLFLNPFSAESAYHRPIGDEAEYASDAHPSRVAWMAAVPANNGQSGGGTVGAINQGHPYGVANIYGAPTDPLRTFTKRNCTNTGEGSGHWGPGETSVQLRIPGTNGINTNPTYQCAECTAFIGQEDFSTYEFFTTIRDGDAYRGSICRVGDLRGLGHGSTLGDAVGVSASGCSVRMGMLSAAALLAEEEILHALKLAIYSGRSGQPHALLSRWIQWPACRADAFASNPANNTGPFPYGAHVALKPSLDLSTIGLTTPQGYILGRCLQKYGAYCLDDADGMVIRADGSLGVNAAAIVADYRKLLRHLYLITNSVAGVTAAIAADGGYNLSGSIGTPSYPAGGGTALAPNTALIA